MARETKASGKRTASKRVRKAGSQSKPTTAAASPHRSTQKRRTRGGGDTARKTAGRATGSKIPAPLALVRETPIAQKHESVGAVRLYTRRTRAAISAAWNGMTANIIAQARARGRQLLGQIKHVSLQVTHMTQPSPKKHRVSAG